MRIIYSVRPEPDATPDEAAATWLSLMLSGDASSEDQEMLEAWRTENEDNALAWSKVSIVWDYSASARDEPEIAAMRRQALARPKQRSNWMPVALAASLAIAVIGVGITSNGFGLGGSGGTQIAMETRDFRTKVGQRSDIPLSDGSTMTLNTDSAVHVALSKSERRIELASGEAYFDVAKDKTRPFVVDTAKLTITALGTRFAVRALDDGATVALVEGSVRVARQGAGTNEAVVLQAGSILRLTPSGFEVTRGDAARLANWRTGRLSFDQTPLAAAVEEMNRYTTKPILLSTPSLGSTPVTGLFATDRPDELVTMLTASGAVHAARQPDGSILLKPAQ